MIMTIPITLITLTPTQFWLFLAAWLLLIILVTWAWGRVPRGGRMTCGDCLHRMHCGRANIPGICSEWEERDG